MVLLQARRAERVAGIEVAGLETLLEPACPLRRGAVVEAFRHDIALCAALDGVIADLRRRVQRL